MIKFLKIAVGLLLLLFVLFLGVGLLSSSFEYENRITIERTPEQVWTVFTDQERMGDWLDGFVRIENLSGNPMEVGSRWKLVFDMDGEVVELIEEMTVIEPNRRFAFNLETDPFSGTTDVRLTPSGEHTELVATSTVIGRNIFMRAFMRIMKGYFEKQAQKSYDKLKVLAEAS